MAKRTPARRSRSATSSSVASARRRAKRFRRSTTARTASTRAKRPRATAKKAERLVLNNAFAFGGLNSALALRAWEA